MSEVKQGEFEASTGLKIVTIAVDPMVLQRVINSVPQPKRPTYESRTISGRVEVHPMDEESAKQTPGGELSWQVYSEEKASAAAAQNERLMKALFFLGTKCDTPEDGWDTKWSFFGIEVPNEPNERRAFYLSSELPTADTVALMGAIMRLTGVDEEVLKQAEESFRATTREGSE